MASERPVRHRLIQLDVLRGLAILLVLGHHAVSPPATAGLLRPLAGLWNRFGWTGVDLFFVLSGFLIGGLLFEEISKRGRLDVGRFLIRRMFKIWPSYYLFVAFVLGSSMISDPPASGRILLSGMPTILNVQNYLTEGPCIHLWSLAVEEHFYLLLPLILSWMVRRKSDDDESRSGHVVSGVFVLVVFLMVACTAMRLLTTTSSKVYVYQTHMRIDSLAFGVLLASVRQFRPAVWAAVGRHRTALLVLGLALIAPMTVFVAERSRFVTTLGFTCLYLGYGAILVAFMNASDRTSWLGRILHGRAARIVAFVGTFSYPIYLWHINLGQKPAIWLFGIDRAPTTVDPTRWSAAMAVYLMLAIGGGVVFGRWIERPSLALRDRLFPGRTRPIGDEETPPGLSSTHSVQAAANG